jgi:hypothetical protein
METDHGHFDENGEFHFHTAAGQGKNKQHKKRTKE